MPCAGVIYYNVLEMTITVILNPGNINGMTSAIIPRGIPQFAGIMRSHYTMSLGYSLLNILHILGFCMGWNSVFIKN